VSKQPIPITMYECPYCHKKLNRTLGSAIRHTGKCYHNPIRKACVTCNSWEDSGKYKIFHCKDSHDMVAVEEWGGEIHAELQHDCNWWELKFGDCTCNDNPADDLHDIWNPTCPVHVKGGER